MIPAEAVEVAQEAHRAALEAAAPYMLAATVEYAVFRKDGDEYDAPLGHRTYARRGRAEASMRQFINCDDWLEIRERTVTPWKGL